MAEVRPGLRGVVASTDIEVDKAVVVLPHNLAIPLATSVAPAPVRWACITGTNMCSATDTYSGKFAPFFSGVRKVHNKSCLSAA